MIACLDQRRSLSHSGVESPPPPDSSDPDLLTGDADPTATADFGGMVHNRPAAIIRPTTTDAVSRAIRLASRSDRLTVAARGNGHSIHGQAMADGGIVLDMRYLGTSIRMDLVWSPSGAPLADVPSGALWEEVLDWGVNTHRLAPASWTDYLGLTVGGTLSNGGISGQAFRVGPQVSNVAELEIVTGDGERRVCSPAANPDLFFAALGGLGQFGVITRARIPLHPAPDMVKWMRVVYTRFEDYAGDAERLVSPPGGLVDYVEGFAFVNREDDPVNGWGSVLLRNGSVLDRSGVPPAAGPVLYCLEVAIHYDRGEEAAVDERAAGILRTLRYVRGLEFETEVSYVGFLTRVNRAEEEARANGSWHAPHPWLNLLVSRADIADFDRHVFKRILRDGVGGPMLVYPLLKSKWDPRATVAVPESEVFYLVALLRFGRPSPEGKAAEAEEMVVQNREIVDWCEARGYDYKVYLPHYETEEGWARHFGRRGWARFVGRKAMYDPLAILAPGHNIFTRSRPPPPPQQQQKQ